MVPSARRYAYSYRRPESSTPSRRPSNLTWPKISHVHSLLKIMEEGSGIDVRDQSPHNLHQSSIKSNIPTAPTCASLRRQCNRLPIDSRTLSNKRRLNTHNRLNASTIDCDLPVTSVRFLFTYTRRMLDDASTPTHRASRTTGFETSTLSLSSEWSRLHGLFSSSNLRLGTRGTRAASLVEVLATLALDRKAGVGEKMKSPGERKTLQIHFKSCPVVSPLANSSSGYFLLNLSRLSWASLSLHWKKQQQRDKAENEDALKALAKLESAPDYAHSPGSNAARNTQELLRTKSHSHRSPSQTNPSCGTSGTRGPLARASIPPPPHRRLPVKALANEWRSRRSPRRRRLR